MFARVFRYAGDACLQVSLRGNRGSELVQDVESCRSAGYVEIDVRFDQQRAPGLHPRRHTLIDTRAAALQTFRILPDLYERSEEHTSELQSLMRISYAVFCLKKKKINASIKLSHQLQTHNLSET